MSEDPPAAKYVVQIFEPEKPTPTPKQFVQDLKGVAGGKQIARMKKEAVARPGLNTTVSFAPWFARPNLIPRVKGKIGCTGLASPVPWNGEWGPPFLIPFRPKSL